jgi:hypothetical protein
VCIGNYSDIDKAAKSIASINNIDHTQVKYDLLDKEGFSDNRVCGSVADPDDFDADPDPDPTSEKNRIWILPYVKSI